MLKAQNIAISQMAEARHEYNLGVLSMLGHEQRAATHSTLSGLAAVLCDRRDAVDTNGDDLASMLAPLNPEAAAIQAEIDEIKRRIAAAWMPIQALIDEAKNELGAADPMGLSQHA